MRVHGMQFKPLGARIGKFRAARADFLPEIAGPKNILSSLRVHPASFPLHANTFI